MDAVTPHTLVQDDWRSIIVGPIIIAPLTRRVLVCRRFTVGADRVSLPPRLYQMMFYLGKHAETPVPYEELWQAVFSFPYNSDSLITLVTKIREGLESARAGSSEHLTRGKKRAYMLSSLRNAADW